MGSIMTPRSERVPVLIIGAGPSGATTALHLARLGINSLVISRHRGTANTPRAHIFNQRAMEVLRDADLEQRCLMLSSGAADMAHSSFLNSLSGEEYARLWAWGNKPSEKGAYDAASPCSMSDLPQSLLEPILVEEASKLGVQFRFYTEFVSLEQHPDLVKTKVRYRGVAGGLHDDDGAEQYEVHSDYVVGCDGARSAVIDALGIPIDGCHLNTAFNVHIEADLGQFVQHRPGSLNWILNTEAPEWSAVGNFRMVRPWTEWIVSMHPASTESQGGEEITPSESDILHRIRQMIGEAEDVENPVAVKILSTFRWTINNQVARTWHKGRALCIGDATHRHPPINGLGSNTCLGDAFNLAWKLAFVLKGHAHPDLLKTLTVERKPVGDGIVRRANQGMEMHRHFWSLIGLTPETRRQALDRLRDPGVQGQLARQEWNQALEDLDLEVQALGVQMNQVYVNSPATYAESTDQPPDFGFLNPIKELMVSTYPGYHLPHAWVVADSQSPVVSTLDLTGHGRFTLLAGPGGGRVWKEAVEAVTRQATKCLLLDLKCYSIGFGCDYLDCYRDWQRARGVSDSGVVLVRPDHFVAWRCHEAPTDATATLQEVLLKVLGWSSAPSAAKATSW